MVLRRAESYALVGLYVLFSLWVLAELSSAVGYPVPAGVPVGERTVATGYGRVTIRVWYV